MKKLYIAFISALMSLILIINANAQTVSVGSLINPPATFGIGDNITIPVHLSYNQLRSFALYLEYDTDVLTYVASPPYTDGNAALTGGWPLSVSQPLSNRLYISWGLFSGSINFTVPTVPADLVLNLHFIYNGGVSLLTFVPTLTKIINASNVNVLTSGGITNGSINSPYVNISSLASNNWNVQATWSGIGSQTQPTPAHNVSIENGHTVTITANGVCNNLTIKAGGNLVVNSGITLKVKGNLIIQSSATGTGNFVNLGTLTLTGTATVQRYLTGGHYHYVSSPISNGAYTILQQSPNTSHDFFSWSEPNHLWIDHNDSTNISQYTGILTAGRGYAVQYAGAPVTKSFTGTLNQGTVLFGITKNNYSGVPSADRNYNLIGNPYPAYITAKTSDPNNLLSVNMSLNLFGSLYFWAEDDNIFEVADYATWNGTGGVAGGLGPAPDGYISPGQAFFVKALNAGNVNFTNAMKVPNTGAFYKTGDNVFRYRLTLSNGNTGNQMLVGFLANATNGADDLYDAVKYSGNPDISLYSILGGEHYAIQGLPVLNSNVTVPVGMYAGATGSYTFETGTIENLPANVIVYLEDTEANQLVNILDDTYTFNVNSTGNYDSRFLLHFSIITGVGQVDNTGLNIYSFDESVYINCESPFSGKVEIFDMIGQVIINQDVENIAFRKINLNCETGYYLVKVTTDSSVFTQKVFIR